MLLKFMDFTHLTTQGYRNIKLEGCLNIDIELCKN